MKRVRYCTNSTIFEAWAVILGLPAPTDPTDVPAIERAARRELPDLRLVASSSESGPAGAIALPAWTRSYQGEDGRYTVRFGHRFLSLHFRTVGGVKYETYGASLQPWVDRWLRLYRDSLGADASRHEVDKVGFGYANAFMFDLDDFDASRYFRVSFEVDPGPGLGLTELQTRFQFVDPGRRTTIGIGLDVTGPASDTGQVRASTKIFAERFGTACSFADSERLASTLEEAKDAAKERFFAFSTDETHHLMGAVYEEGGERAESAS